MREDAELHAAHVRNVEMRQMLDTQVAEEEARAWIEGVLGEPLEGTTHEALKSGVVLCNLLNAIAPGVCPKPSKITGPIKRSLALSRPAFQSRRSPCLSSDSGFSTSGEENQA